MKLALTTLIIFYSCILIGFIYQYLLTQKTVLNRFRLKDHAVNLKNMHQHMKLVIFNLVLLGVLTFFGLSLVQGDFNTTSPTMLIFIEQFLLFLFLDDLCFYIWHRNLHENTFLLRKIHAVHHRVRNPAPLEFIYVHPIEWMVGSLGVVLAIFAIIEFYGQANAFVFWSYIVFRTLHELDIHSSTRSILFKYFPFFGTVEHHDTHHLRAIGNYASSLTYLDKLFGTKTQKLLEKRRASLKDA